MTFNMDETSTRKYETMLLKLRESLRDEIEKTSKTSAPVELDGTMGRISRADAMQAQQVALEVKRRRKERIVRIQTALQRIHQGTFGSCGRCSNPIKPARLDAFPDSVLCVTCASKPRG
jgi:DnaK suppressor protein